MYLIPDVPAEKLPKLDHRHQTLLLLYSKRYSSAQRTSALDVTGESEKANHLVV